MKRIIVTLVFVVASTLATAQSAKEIIAQSVEAIGGAQNFYNKGTVSYDYEYRAPKGENAITLVGKETYMFDGERSYATYTTHSLTGANGKVVEGYNGTDAWVTFDGKVSDDQQANGVARFLRKTNYYWFAMFFKLADNGVNHELLSDQKVNGKDYKRIKITFGDQVGDAQDTYIIYVNKETKLIDQFLFTVVGFGISDPYLMTFDYETIDGIKIPTKRKYIEADWDGNVKGKAHYITNWTNIQFGVDVEKSLFEKP
ncbi:DUF6503 family protein [Aquimarina spongiae]|uniref:Outer membrane lipoprotein-sorting protein n=1 Tax=Aquimarina spongiae TaxID=570521 RepID=A0A1M6B2U2_9FLAO|nr:DUF6503 family protein [Aquimarina spongiae]SHI43051.1 hypothetical protein SAMN04488508_101600 [Aquimarina spongiae]